MEKFSTALSLIYHDKQIKKRMTGLDSLRALAILLVFLYHYPAVASLKFAQTIGWTGVDLFFVLSGYLIGNQILSALAKQHTFSLKNFWYRRLMRTLPNYWFVLVLYCVLPGFREWHLPMSVPVWKFLTFTQNYGLSPISAFSDAWSLCVEEQFYLIFPLLILALFYKRSVRMIWIMLAAVIIFETVLRIMLWEHYMKNLNFSEFLPTFTTYMTHIYYPTYTRLYGLIFGIIIALIKNFHTELWSNLTMRGNVWLILGVLGCAVSFYAYRDFTFMFNFYPTILAYPLLDLSFMFLVLAALSPNSYLSKLHVPGTTMIATWSYAMYLLQKPLIFLTDNFLAQWQINKMSLLAMFITLIIVLAFSFLLYTFIEMPFLKLRDRKFLV